ncbi:TPA: peptidase domain-containing ABC transporter [Staphylococcus aureus]|nr:peptidase domain-containing ABC transporter [Staphylococcus aureus]
MVSKIRIVEQLEHSECGLACVVMICNYFGKETTLSKLREEYGVPNGGFTLLNLKKILENNDIMFKGVKIKDISLLSKIKDPAILFWKEKHFVVLCRSKNGKFLIADPANGKKWIDKKEFEKNFSEIALINNQTKIVKSNNKIRKYDFLISLLKENKNLLIKLILISFIIQLLSISIPIIIKNLMDIVYVNENKIFPELIMISLLVLFSFYIMNVIRTFIVTKIQVKMDDQLMSKVFMHLLSLPYSFFQNRSTGEIIFRLNSNNYIRQILSEKVISVALDILLLFLYLVIMIRYSLILTVVVLLIGLFILMISIVNAKKLNGLNEKQVILMAEVQKILTQSVEGILSIKSSNFSDYIYTNWREKFSEQLVYDLKKSKWSAFLPNISKTVQIGLPLIIYLMSVNLYHNGTISVGEIVAFNTISGYFLIPLISFSESYADLLTLKIYVNKLLDIISTNKELDGNKQIPYSLDIELKNIEYSYSTYSPLILKNINLKIKRGEKVVIVGESGSGKTTLLKIIMGLIQPNSGEVLFGKENLRNISKTSLRSKLGVVTQKSQIFNTTIIDNIKMKRNISDNDLKKSIEITQVDKIYEHSSIGNNMVVSELGENLSGGQIQKIALARAIVGNPDLLFMDEPTSSLDNISEKKLVDFILSENKTFIMIAHRFSQIEKFDQVIVIDQGEIVGTGSHSELIKNNKKYQELYLARGE